MLTIFTWLITILHKTSITFSATFNIFSVVLHDKRRCLLRVTRLLVFVTYIAPTGVPARVRRRCRLDACPNPWTLSTKSAALSWHHCLCKRDGNILCPVMMMMICGYFASMTIKIYYLTTTPLIKQKVNI